MIERTGGEQRRPSRDERLSADSGSSRSSLVIKTAANDPAPAPRGSRYAAPAQRMVTTERRGSPFRQQEPMLESEDQLVMAQQPIGQPADMPPAFERSPEARLNIDCEAERQKLKPIDAITNNIAAEPGEFPPECENPEDRFQPRNWSATTYTWKASGLCHKPLYFEDWNLERYGHAMPPGIQQVSSAAHFLGAGALLPYKMAMDPPWECQYTLGYFRPSSCAPWMIRPFPASGRGGIAEAAAVTGLIFLIP